MYFAQGTMGRFGGEEIRRLSVEFISVLPWVGASLASTCSEKKRNGKILAPPGSGEIKRSHLNQPGKNL
jgi:hypothetical protein